MSITCRQNSGLLQNISSRRYRQRMESRSTTAAAPSAGARHRRDGAHLTPAIARQRVATYSTTMNTRATAFTQHSIRFHSSASARTSATAGVLARLAARIPFNLGSATATQRSRAARRRTAQRRGDAQLDIDAERCRAIPRSAFAIRLRTALLHSRRDCGAQFPGATARTGAAAAA